MYTEAMKGRFYTRTYLATLRICLSFCALVLLSTAGVLFYVGTANASSWLDGDPELISRRPYDKNKDLKGQSCSEQLVTVVDPNTPGNIAKSMSGCVTDGINFRSLKTTGDVYGSYMYISIGQDKRFYRFITHLGDISMHHVSGTDIVITTYPKYWNSGRQISIYDNFHTQVIKSMNGSVSYGWIENPHQLDIDDPDGLIAQGWGVSENGRYIAYGINVNDNVYTSLDQFVRYDTVTGERKMFGKAFYLYKAYPYDPPEFAVSNDGREIVATGASTLKFWEVNSSCMVEMTHDSIKGDVCPSRIFYPKYYDNEGRQYDDSRLLYYNEDEQTIRYVFESAQHETITVRKPGYEPPEKLKYPALGDSYSSGEGDVDNGYIKDTEQPGQCHVSLNSYPFLLRNKWNISTSQMKSVACSGAQVRKDYMSNMNTYKGQDNRLAKDKHSDLTKKQALDKFTPGIVPQIEFVNKYKPEVVSLTGGGNDVGFGRILVECVSSVGTCSYADTSRVRQALLESVHAQYDVVKTLIGKIQEVSPSTEIIIVGYPQFVAQPLNGCGLNSGLLNNEEKYMIRYMVGDFNRILRQVALDTGVSYADIEGSLAGGQLCENGHYVTGIRDIGLGKLVRLRSQEAFHPNATGHAKMAEAIYRHNLLVDKTRLSTKSLSYYSDYENYPVSIQVDLTDNEILTKQGILSISQPPATFEPNSSVEVTIFSDPVSLGTVIASEDGSLSFDVNLPESIDIGYHFLMVEGKTFSGEPMTLYQFITVISNTPDDVDGDGITDNEDVCTFISQWFDEATGEDVCNNTKSLDNNKHISNDKNISKNDDIQIQPKDSLVKDKATTPKVLLYEDVVRGFLEKNGLLLYNPVAEFDKRINRASDDRQHLSGRVKNGSLVVILGILVCSVILIITIGKLHHAKKS